MRWCGADENTKASGGKRVAKLLAETANVNRNAVRVRPTTDCPPGAACLAAAAVALAVAAGVIVSLVGGSEKATVVEPEPGDPGGGTCRGGGSGADRMLAERRTSPWTRTHVGLSGHQVDVLALIRESAADAGEVGAVGD